MDLGYWELYVSLGKVGAGFWIAKLSYLKLP